MPLPPLSFPYTHFAIPVRSAALLLIGGDKSLLPSPAPLQPAGPSLNDSPPPPPTLACFSASAHTCHVSCALGTPTAARPRSRAQALVFPPSPSRPHSTLHPQSIERDLSAWRRCAKARQRMLSLAPSRLIMGKTVSCPHTAAPNARRPSTRLGARGMPWLG